MSVRDLLVDALNNLGNDEFDTFNWYLTGKVLDGCKPIAKFKLENTTRWKTVSTIIDNYGNERGVAITVAVLRKIGQNSAAQALEEAYAGSEEGKVASSSTSSSADARAAQPNITADHGSVIIAPTGTNTKGTWSITVEQS